MLEAIGKVPTLTLALIAAVAILVIALVVVGVVLIVRRRPREPKPPVPTPLSEVWRAFLRQLPASARGDPVVIVLGERLAGKSSAIRAGFERGGSHPHVSPSAPEDPRLGLHAGGNVLVQELSSELLEDTRPETREALRKLWAPIALGAPLVTIVLDTHAPSWSPGGLRRLGSLARDRINLLTALRGRPPRVRVCLTHLDESAEGFAELAAIALENGQIGSLPITGRGAPELAASLALLERNLVPALRSHSAAEFGRLTRFLTGSGARLLGALEPFLDALLGGQGAGSAPPLDGIVLAALPESGAAAMLGDPIGPDAASVAGDAAALDRRRTTRALIVGAAVAAALAVVYGLHYGAVGGADRAVDSFAGAVTAAQADPQMTWASNLRARTAEREAAEALDSALDPLWPPLRLAFPGRKETLAADFVKQIRGLYLLPAARGPDRVKRIYALALIYAAQGNALGAHGRRDHLEWAEQLDLPVRIVDDYLAWSQQAWTGRVQAPEAASGEVALEDWQRWLKALDADFKRGEIGRDELDKLQKDGVKLSSSVLGALEVRGLETVVQELRDLRGAEVEDFFGPKAAMKKTPEWVSENWEALENLLGMVQRASLDVPAAKDKSLRSALVDLASAGRADPDEASPTAFQLAVEGRVQIYQEARWASLIRRSRAAIYTQDFLKDVRKDGRLCFFVRGRETIPVAVGSNPSRGPSRPLSVIYTSQAVEEDVKPALLTLDATLEGARVPAAERDELVALVRRDIKRYADDYQTALFRFVGGFHLTVTSPAGLRADIEDMVGPSSWFTDFWVTVAQNARVDPEGNQNLQVLADKFRPFGSIVDLMTGDKGKYPSLEKYYAVLATLPASIDATAPQPPGAPGTPLEDRLSPLGKLGLAVLDQDKPAPLPQVQAFLDGARILDRSFRAPFLAPVEQTYEYALRIVERTLDDAYREQVRPMVTPFFERFPFDPRSNVDASPPDTLAVLGPKGSFRGALDPLLAPVCKRGIEGPCLPRSPVGFRSVKLPSDSTALARWATGLGALLWDADGKPKPLSFTALPYALPDVKEGDGSVVTLSYLRSGTSTVYGFNQAPTWQALSVIWSTPSAASVGVERVVPGADTKGSGGFEKSVETQEASGSVWRFYRLLCKASRVESGVYSWALEPAVVFELRPEDPWAAVVPPPNRDRRCGAPRRAHK